jgi:hypothetical protein
VRFTLGLVVGMLLAFPEPAVDPAVHVVTYAVLTEAEPDVSIMCQAAAERQWDGTVEDDPDLRAGCLLTMLRLLDWPVLFDHVAVASDWADALHGGPCAAVAHYREYGSW